MNDFLERNSKYIFLMPAIILLIVFGFFPIIQLLRLSFSSFTLYDIGEKIDFTGFKNVKNLMGDKTFGQSLKVTATFVVGVVLVELILGFLIALAVYNVIKRNSFFRTVFVVPMMVPAITIGMIWRLMYNTEFGIINSVLRELGVISPPLWLANPDIALMSVMVVDIWHWTPFVFLLIFAGLQSIPEEPYEAAALEGASDSQTFRFITLPLLSKTIFITLMLRTVLAFKAFDELFILTSGGPGNATEIIGLYIYKTAFSFGKIGYSAFLSLITIIIMLIISGIFRLIVRSTS